MTDTMSEKALGSAQLVEDLAALREQEKALQNDIAALEAEAVTLFSADGQVKNLRARGKIEAELAATTKTIQAGERLLAQLLADEAAEAQRAWESELHPQAMRELHEAEDAVMNALRRCKGAFNKWQALHLEWEARRGEKHPGLARCPASLGDWLRPSPFDAGARERCALVR